MLKRIDQRDEYQIIKLLIDYKKLVNYQTFYIFVNYENEYIYRIIFEKNQIKQIFNVERQNNKCSHENFNHNNRLITKFIQFSSTIEIIFKLVVASINNKID